MKFPLPVLFLIFVFLSCNKDHALHDTPDHRLTAAQFTEKMKDSSVLVIDVSLPSEFASAHLLHAVNIYFDGNFEKQVDIFDKNRTYLLYGHTDSRSEKAYSTMMQSGFQHVYTLIGGTVAWKGELVR